MFSFLSDLDDTLEGLALSKTLKKIVKGVQDERLKLQAYIYQAQRLKRLARWKEIAYDKTNQQHEEMLLRLWDVTFPGEQLTARVSDQWKKMGFQGTDPVRFRSKKKKKKLKKNQKKKNRAIQNVSTSQENVLNFRQARETKTEKQLFRRFATKKKKKKKTKQNKNKNKNKNNNRRFFGLGDRFSWNGFVGFV